MNYDYLTFNQIENSVYQEAIKRPFLLFQFAMKLAGINHVPKKMQKLTFSSECTSQYLVRKSNRDGFFNWLIESFLVALPLTEENSDFYFLLCIFELIINRLNIFSNGCGLSVWFIKLL